MNESSSMVLSLLAGVLLGIIFFGGLWWTIQKGVGSQNPAPLFAGSLLLRTAIALAGFYFVSDGDWRKLLACLFGFSVARIGITRFTRGAVEESAQIAQAGER
jgi:F1F0 ATPase subunit 2